MVKKLLIVIMGLLLPISLFGTQVVEKKSLSGLLKRRQARLLFVGKKSAWKTHYIKGSKHIEANRIANAYLVLPGRPFTVVVYSDSMKQALDAAVFLEKKHYKKVYVLKTGSFPTRKNLSKRPVARQVKKKIETRSSSSFAAEECENTIILYGSSTCGRCANMRKELKAHNLKYTEYDVNKDRTANMKMWKKIQKTQPHVKGVSLPVMEINGKVILNKYRYKGILPYLNSECTVDNDIKSISVDVQKSKSINKNRDKVKAEFYSDATEHFKLDLPGKKLQDKIKFKGWSDYTSLWIQIRKEGSSVSHDMKFEPGGGDFDVSYLFKDGTGRYKVYILGSGSASAKRYKGLVQFKVDVTRTLGKEILQDSLNKEVIDFVNRHKGEKIGRGECWDVAQQALDENAADWSRPVRFGIPLNPAKDKILPGDIIQFKSVKTKEIITNVKNGRISIMTRTSAIGAPDHTAVVYRVLGKNDYEVMHQNVDGKRYIIKGKINLNGMKSGQVWFYRPIRGLMADENNE